MIRQPVEIVMPHPQIHVGILLLPCLLSIMLSVTVAGVNEPTVAAQSYVDSRYTFASRATGESA